MKKIRFFTALLAFSMLGAVALTGCTQNHPGAVSSPPEATASTPGTDSTVDLLDKITEAGVIIIGTEGTYSPNSYHDESGALLGFDVEVDRVDIVVNEVEYSEDRALKYDFSQPYTYIHGALMVAEDNGEITGFEDLDGKRSAQNLTSSWGQMAERYGAELVSIDALSQCVELLLTGRADATLNAETAFYDYLNAHPNAALKIVALTDTTTSSVVPVPKGNERLVAAIDVALNEMRESGELAELSTRYFGQDITSQ